MNRSLINLLHPIRGMFTQGFGVNPDDYKHWGYPGHNGVDWGAPVDTNVVAAAEGLVSKIAFEDGGFGNYLVLSHENGSYFTYYAHLSRALVKPGDKVERGQPVAKSGNTGYATGPHLHFGLKIPGENPAYKGYVDPLPYFAAVEGPLPISMPEGGEATESLFKARALVSLNIRQGPGVEYPGAGVYNPGQVVDILGIDTSTVWVRTPDGHCAMRWNGDDYLEVDKSE